MASVTEDNEALLIIMQAHADGFKFSSECLELVLKKNLLKASDYMLNEYYPHTNIDTEIIVRSVVNEVQRNQDYTIFQLKQRMLPIGETFPKFAPVVYWA